MGNHLRGMESEWRENGESKEGEGHLRGVEWEEVGET